MNLGLNHSILNLLDYFDLFENFEDCSIASCSSYREKNVPVVGSNFLTFAVILQSIELYKTFSFF